MKKVIGLTLLMVLLGISACSPADEQGTPADFTLQTTDGKTIVLSQVYQDKMVVLDFWASWCPHCIKVMPDLEKFYSENKDKVTVIGVNVKESKLKVEAVIQQTGITYPVVLDSDGRVATTYKVRGIPTIITIEKGGKIIYSGHSAAQAIERIEL